MINRHKVSTLEQKFPLLAIEDGFIISKDADITAAFRLEMPELFTITAEEYESMHSTWHKAIKVLPNHTIIHKQDWFVTEKYKALFQMRRNPALQDSPPAADCFSSIFPVLRSVILPGEIFCITGKRKVLSCDTKKD